jgi:hypothetical protein
MKPVISFDVDDVLADFHKRYRQVAHDLFPQYGELPTSLAWDQPNWLLTPDEKTLLHMTWKTIPNIYASLDVCPGVNAKFLQILQHRAHLLFVSARHENPASHSAHSQTVNWLESNLGLDDPMVVIASDKGPVLRVAQALVHFDDARHCVQNIEPHMRPRSVIYPLRTPQPVMVKHCQNHSTFDFDDVCTLINRILRQNHVEAIPIG